MRVLWFVLITCSLACGNSHAQSLNERLLKAIDAGKYDEAKKLILQGASPNYIQEIYSEGEKSKSLLQDFMTIKSKTGKKALAEVTGKLIILPFIAIISMFTSRNKEPSGFYIHSTPLDHALYQADTPQRTQFVTWLFRRGARRMYTQKQDDLFRCAILSQDLFFISQLLKQGYNTRVSINQEPCIYYVMDKYPAKARYKVIDWLLTTEKKTHTQKILCRDVLKQTVRNNETELLPRLIKHAQTEINNDPLFFSEVLTLTADVKVLETLMASGIKMYKTAILHKVIDANAPKKDIYSVLKFFLEKGGKVNASAGYTYSNKASPLSFFIHKHPKKHTLSMYNTVQLLLDYGANPLIQYDPAIPDALTQAIIRQDDQLFKLLLKYLSPQQIKEDTIPHVKIACQYFSPQYIQALIAKGFEWKDKGDLLGYLLDINDLKKLAFLTYFLEQGAPPNVVSKYVVKKNSITQEKAFTPFNLLLAKSNPQLIYKPSIKQFCLRAEVLMKHGATPLLDMGKGSVMNTFIKQKDKALFKFILERLTPQHMKAGNTQPLITACRYFDKDMMWALIDKQQDWLTPVQAKDFALKHLLVYDEDRQRGKDKWRVLKHLLNQETNFNITKKRPVLNYLIEGHPQMEQSRRQARSFRRYARLLLKHQAQPLPQANDAKSALYLAVEKNFPTAVKMFLPQVPDSLAKQDTALIALALEHKASYSTVKRLLEKGFTQSKQYSPLALLIKQRPNQLGLVGLLIKYGADLKQTPRGHDAIAEAKYWMKQKPAQQAAYQKLIRLLEKAWKRQYKQPYQGKE